MCNKVYILSPQSKIHLKACVLPIGLGVEWQSSLGVIHLPKYLGASVCIGLWLFVTVLKMCVQENVTSWHRELPFYFHITEPYVCPLKWILLLNFISHKQQSVFL